ncbi:MAG: transcription termination/antitermination NusG family protein [Nitrospira sp.]
MRWYVLSTKSGREKQAEQNIRRMGVESFLPLLQEQKAIRRRTRTVITPLFPGYLFVRINLSEHYRAVTYARGVRKILAFGATPVAVDSSMIESIKGRMASSEMCVLEKRKELSSGQLVQINDGPFVGLEAVFMREMSGHQRAMVLVRTLALQARIVLEINQLIPYYDDAAA